MTAQRTRIEKRRNDRVASRDKARSERADPGEARNRAWDGHSTGTGGEGFSKGYGGSAGTGTGHAGPESKARQETRRGRR